MSPLAHRIYVSTLVTIVLFVTLFLVVTGLSYYGTSLEERFYHPEHQFYKPSGVFGHGLGIIGTLLIIIGVFSYIARKRYKFLANFGRLKYWLEFHIFLCSLGPILILFHTAFKFGGIVAISFWSMVAVVLSGVIGRFIYIQIPRSIEGRELSFDEVKEMKRGVEEILQTSAHLDDQRRQAIVQSIALQDVSNGGGSILGNMIGKYFEDQATIRQVKGMIRAGGMPKSERRQIVGLLKDEMALNNKIGRLKTMQELFKYWHVVHLPFAIIMLVIMIIHVGVTIAFGYRWIF